MADIEGILVAYDEVFAIMKAAVDARDVTGQLRCKPLEPLFRVR
jgi:glutamate-1-semialdehyde 2,1-aminomutase